MKNFMPFLILIILFSTVNAQNTFITNVPDHSQPPVAVIPNNNDITNYCAPIAFLNNDQYWNRVQFRYLLLPPGEGGV